MSDIKVAVVTGAGTGIGKSVALALLAEGYQVGLVGRQRSRWRILPLTRETTPRTP